MSASLYMAQVMHARPGKPMYRFVYRLACVFLDIDRLADDVASLRWFSLERWNLFSFRMRDHLPAGERDARQWIERILAAQGIDLHGGPIRLLCMPRVLGYAFNPLSVWYCYDPEGSLRAILCEVRNTFGEKHHYLLPVSEQEGADTTWEAAKAFHVSPFFPVSGTYRFRLDEPERRLAIRIEYRDRERAVMRATLAGRRQALDDVQLVRLILRYPLMTFKVIAMIHWQALKLWSRHARFHRKPPAPDKEVTLAWARPRNPRS